MELGVKGYRRERYGYARRPYVTRSMVTSSPYKGVDKLLPHIQQGGTLLSTVVESIGLFYVHGDRPRLSRYVLMQFRGTRFNSDIAEALAPLSKLPAPQGISLFDSFIPSLEFYRYLHYKSASRALRKAGL